ncbi:NAD(P)-binding protein [Pleomassaria siparia CBS 279.74]|uniref:NAD(P)-binding protein n=1 Tax=Pleomassaria siparia CBS 279.74 TaxID=1314801 RepID=A0A6G1K9Q0_9PLEO|nr:NAD(P)-binding protein [Pleomassaria siparia CBS 279.74]
MTRSKKQVALIVGASRGIGRQVAIDLAKEGYAVVVAAKSTSDASKVSPFPPDPNSSASTISTVEREIRSAGYEATAIAVDTRDYVSIQAMMDQTVSVYGGLDVLIYNSGAIWWASVEKTPMKRFQLMQRVNVEGLYGVVQAALPLFEKNAWKGRVVVVSPPIYSRFFRGKTAYAVGKVGMSVLTKGLAMDWEREGKTDMAITSIWPATAIQSAATENLDRDHQASSSSSSSSSSNSSDLRKPTIYSDAIIAMLRTPATQINGHLELDEDFLRKTGGVTDFDKYSLVPGSRPRRMLPVELPDLTVEEQDDEGRRVDSTVRRRASKI